MFKTQLFCLLLLSLAVLPVMAVGQCIGDDGLYTGKCYQPVHAKLPQIPALKSRSLILASRRLLRPRGRRSSSTTTPCGWGSNRPDPFCFATRPTELWKTPRSINSGLGWGSCSDTN